MICSHKQQGCNRKPDASYRSNSRPQRRCSTCARSANNHVNPAVHRVISDTHLWPALKSSLPTGAAFAEPNVLSVLCSARLQAPQFEPPEPTSKSATSAGTDASLRSPGKPRPSTIRTPTHSALPSWDMSASPTRHQPAGRFPARSGAQDGNVNTGFTSDFNLTSRKSFKEHIDRPDPSGLRKVGSDG